jgi:hypothetical protein
VARKEELEQNRELAEEKKEGGREKKKEGLVAKLKRKISGLLKHKKEEPEEKPDERIKRIQMLQKELEKEIKALSEKRGEKEIETVEEEEVEIVTGGEQKVVKRVVRKLKIEPPNYALRVSLLSLLLSFLAVLVLPLFGYNTYNILEFRNHEPYSLIFYVWVGLAGTAVVAGFAGFVHSLFAKQLRRKKLFKNGLAWLSIVAIISTYFIICWESTLTSTFMLEVVTIHSAVFVPATNTTTKKIILYVENWGAEDQEITGVFINGDLFYITPFHLLSGESTTITIPYGWVASRNYYFIFTLGNGHQSIQFGFSSPS